MKYSLDFTRYGNSAIDSIYEANISGEYTTSIIVDTLGGKNIELTESKINMYGYYALPSGDNKNVNLARDIMRTGSAPKFIENDSPKDLNHRYYGYRYASHYPTSESYWTKFSRFHVEYSSSGKGYKYLEYMKKNRLNITDFYTFISLFDDIHTKVPYFINITFNNTRYHDYQKNNPTSDKFTDGNPIKFHARNIYMTDEYLYININRPINIYVDLANNRTVLACKYMAIKVGNTLDGLVSLNGLYSLCSTHAYLLFNGHDETQLSLAGLLKGCRATKFGDINDSRTILNMSNLTTIGDMCLNSNVEDLSMHTIEMSPIEDLDMSSAFRNSKLKRLPNGFLKSLSRASGYKKVNAQRMFFNTNISDDISDFRLPIREGVPAKFLLDGMYERSGCRRINTGIVSRNNDDIISAGFMYRDCKLDAESELPEDVFKNYTNTYGMFKNTIFDSPTSFAHTYKAISKYHELGDASYNDRNDETPFMGIGIKNSTENSDVTVSGEKVNLLSFVVDDRKSKDSKYYNINITGFRSFKDKHNSIRVVAPKCKELRYGCSYSDLKTISTKDQFNNKYGGLFLGFDDLRLSSFDDSSGVPAFFKVNIVPNTALDLFREIRLMLIGNDYYNLYNKIFEGIFAQNIGAKNNGGKDTTAVLFSNTNTSIEMLSLDELKDAKYTGVLLSRYTTDSACAIINTNGKNLKWTLSKYHYKLYNNKFEYNTPYGAYRYYDYISVFTNAVYLRRAILAQMYFTKSFENEKIEFIFRAKTIDSLKEFMALMSQYMSTTDNSKPVGRYLLLYNNETYDSKTDMDSINRLISGIDLQPYITKLNEDTSVPS